MCIERKRRDSGAPSDGALFSLSGYQRARRHVEFDDLVSEGCVALISAYGRYDSSKATFRTFAQTRVRSAMLDYLRSLDPLSRGQRKLTPEHVATVELPEDYELAQPPRAQRIAELRIAGETQRDIALEVGCCEAWVSCILANIKHGVQGGLHA